MAPVSPYPQTVPADVKFADQEPQGDVPKEQCIFSFEYQKDGKRLITVANTWDYGECFFKIRFPNLPTDGKYRLSEPESKRIFANAAKDPFLTAEELGRGVLVHVGATRWAAFLIEPQSKAETIEADLVRPAEVEKAMAARQTMLVEALERDHVLCRQDFESAPLGALDKDYQGGQILDAQWMVVYVPKGPGGPDLHVEIVRHGNGNALRLLDNDPARALYVRLDLPAPKGVAFFDFTMLKPGPAAITLSAYKMVLAVPSAEQWATWFKTSYQTNLVYLEGPTPEEAAANPKAFKPINTGITVEPGRTYGMMLQWDVPAGKVSIAADGKVIVRDARFFHPTLPVESLVWVTCPHSSGIEGKADILIDNVKVYDRVPEKGGSAM